MKTILVLLDGIGDRSYSMLENLTPLQAARTPNLDALAAMGVTGLYHASTLGQCLPSESAHFLMFGYAMADFPGRGLLEAVGEGVAFNDKDVLCLCHLAGIRIRKGTPVLAHGRDHVKGTFSELSPFYARIASFAYEGIGFRLHHTRRNDGILVISGDASPHVSDADPITRGKPIAKIMPVSGAPDPEKARKTAEALNHYLRYTYDRLHKLTSTPANILVTQRSGRRVSLQPFAHQWGMRPLMIASSAVYAGLANELGFDFARVTDTGDPGRDLRERIRMALDDTKHDFIHVHTKVPDETSHKGTARMKKKAIASLDAGMDELAAALSRTKKNADILAVVTGDHSTPCKSALVHSGEPVPVIFAGRTVRRDRVDRYDEISAAAGALGLMRGRELMQMILNCAERSMLNGLCLGAAVRPYVPEDYPHIEIEDSH
jgi:2,3-bisphosphoglycerate-independent phosphoglycerate mutase